MGEGCIEAVDRIEKESLIEEEIMVCFRLLEVGECSS